MKIQRALLLLLASIIFSALGTDLRAGNPLTLKYSVQEGFNGREAKDAVFEAWIDDGRAVVATTDHNGKVVLKMERALAKGQTLFVEAQSSDGNRFYSWVYRESDLAGEITADCQLVGVGDFRGADVARAGQTN